MAWAGATVRRAAVALIVLFAACTPDSVPFQISPSYEGCGGNRCEQIMTRCDAAIMLRIVDASNGDIYVSECVQVEGGATLCQLLEELMPELQPELLPNRMVRIEMAIWPDEEREDPCPEFAFTVSGKYYPGSGDPPPAIAGLGYFQVGSNEVAPVTLGCVQPETLDAAECRGDTRPHIRAKVIDFDNNVEVGSELEADLTVSVAEPTYDSVNDRWFISTVDTVNLMSTVMGTILTYDVDYPFTFEKTACLQVLQQGIGAAATVRCYPAAPEDIQDNLLEVEGTLLDRDTLFQIQTAIENAGGDPDKLVIGKVYDNEGNPAAGATVTASFGAIQYLSDDLTAVTGDSVTSNSGVFASTDAPFEGPNRETNFWRATRNNATSADSIGGILENKVTIIILKLPPPVKPE